MKNLKRRIALLAAALFTAVLVSGPATAQSNELFLYAWADYVPFELIERFSDETGIDVRLDVYLSNEELAAKLQAGGTGYDVVVPGDYMVQQLAELELLQAIDFKTLPNFENVKGPLLSPAFDPDRLYSAPYLHGSTAIAYDSEKVSAEEIGDSWSIFFDPPSDLQGKIVALNDELEMYKAAALFLGIDYCTESPEDATKILELLEAQKPHLLMYSSDGTIERMAAREVPVHHHWANGPFRVRSEVPAWQMMFPKEGVNLWADNFSIPVGANNVENAKTFINWMMDPENIAEATNFNGYANSIEGADAFTDPAVVQDTGINPGPDVESRYVANQLCSVAARDLRNRVWTRLRS